MTFDARPDPLADPGPGAHESRDRDRTGARLREVAGLVGHRDRMMGRIARCLVDLQRARDLHERLGGMTLQVWLQHVGRLPGADARRLLGAVDVLARMPGMLTGLCDGWLSWAQVAGICRAARRVRVGLLGDLDELVAAAMVRMAEFEPDAIVEDVWQWVDANQPGRLEREERAADRGEFLALQPRLTGGGSLYGELGPVGFATVAEAVTADAPPPDPATLAGGASPSDLDPDELDDLVATLDDRRRAHTRDHGAAMATRLVDLCARDLAGGASTGDSTRRARPLVVATVDLDALCDAARTPGWLLHTVAGGRMKVSSGTLQRLVDERGADLRGVVLDDSGQVVGVGRRTHVPPQWLRHAMWARDLAVRDPDGSCPIRTADLDHVTAWPEGPTDVDNLQPVGRRWHNHKTSKNWEVTRASDGVTTWTHRRHGWTLRLAPPRHELADPPVGVPPPRTTPIPEPPHQPRLTGVP